MNDRFFNQNPHPLIEDHYHIQSLIKGQERRSADRARHQDIEKKRDTALKEIAGFKDIELLDFYCETCDRDFIARAKKQIDAWDTIAYYKTKHTCGTHCIRHITNRELDPFFAHSKLIAYARGEKRVDTLQPFETGYNMVYGKK